MTVERWPALSLREPWLTAVLDLGKRIENRRWNTAFRGRFWLHAAKAMTKLEHREASAFMANIKVQPPMREQLRSHGIAGAATLYHVVPPNWEWVDPRGTAQGINPAWKMAGQYGFILMDVVALPVVIPCRGMLGFFKLPEDVEAAARGALAGVCPCESELVDPGPTHLATCRFADPAFDEGGAL